MPVSTSETVRPRVPPARTLAALTLVLAMAALVVLAAAQAWRSGVQRTSAERDALSFLAELEAFHSAMVDAEAGQRGFLLTGDPAYLAPYQAAEGLASARLQRLRRLAAGDGFREARVEELGTLMGAKLEELRATLALERGGQHDAALARIRAGEGKRAMDALRAVVARLREDVEARRDAASARTRTASRRALLLIVVGGGLLFALLLVSGRLTFRELRALDEAHRERDDLLAFQQRLIGIISHDVRNPLSAILASVLFVRKHGGLGDAQARAIDRIHRGSQRIEKIINTLLDFTHARLGHGIPVHPTMANVHEVGSGVLDEFKAAQPARALEASFEGNGVGYWDAGRLAQLLSNLVGNALKYGAPDAPVRVSMQDAEDAIRIEVHNQGPPIPQEVLPHLFEPFRRGVEPGPRGTDKENLGLGLYIVQQIVAAHGGWIRVHSSAEEGTTFVVELPRTQPPPPEAEAPPTPRARAGAGSGPLQRMAFPALFPVAR